MHKLRCEARGCWRGRENPLGTGTAFRRPNNVITIFDTASASSHISEFLWTHRRQRRNNLSAEKEMYMGYEDNWMPRLYFFIFPRWYWRNASPHERDVSSRVRTKVLIFKLFVWRPELLFFVPLPPVTCALNSLNYAWWLYDVVLWIVNSHNYTSHCLFIISKRMGNYVKLSLKRKAACNMTCHIVHAIQILLLFSESCE